MLDISGRERGLLYRLGDYAFNNLLRIFRLCSSPSLPRGFPLLTDEVFKLPKCSLAVSQAIHRIHENGTLMVHRMAIAVVLPSKASIHASHMRKGVPSEDTMMRKRMVRAGLLPFWADQELRTR
jgi:hypothetical protein